MGSASLLQSEFGGSAKQGDDGRVAEALAHAVRKGLLQDSLVAPASGAVAAGTRGITRSGAIAIAIGRCTTTTSFLLANIIAVCLTKGSALVLVLLLLLLSCGRGQVLDEVHVHLDQSYSRDGFETTQQKV